MRAQKEKKHSHSRKNNLWSYQSYVSIIALPRFVYDLMISMMYNLQLSCFLNVELDLCLHACKHPYEVFIFL